MVLGWGILAPLAILIARFFKILPDQDWPRQLDSKLWWHGHWIGQTAVLLLSAIGLVLVLPANLSSSSFHAVIGYGVLACLLVQVLLGTLRGSKGGPTAPAPDGSVRGHHYDMTLWRRTFETAHKSIGYATLVFAAVTILLGFWLANAPVWMWAVNGLWWSALVIAFWIMERRGMAVDTYQAIWGDDPTHPGNRLPHPGWRVRRPGDDLKGDAHVRRD